MNDFKKQRYSEKFTVKTYEVDFLRRITPFAILGYMQEVATNHAFTLGLGYEESYKNNFIWVLRSAKFEFKSIPLLKDKIEVYTWPVGVSGLKAMRRFEFRMDDKVIGSGYNYWLMIDIIKNKPVIADYFNLKMKDIPIYKNDSFKLRKIICPKETLFSYDKIIMNSDIDWNRHVNNVKYADIIFNAIPINIIENYNIISFHIDYIKECRLNDLIHVLYITKDNQLYVKGIRENDIVFQAVMDLNTR